LAFLCSTKSDNMIKIGILDLGIANKQKETYHVIENTIHKAQLADQLGFSRYWLGEHYENIAAWRNPDILVSVIASITENIKVGVAGIVLPLHSSLRVAQNYRLLSALFPNRIDLGISVGKTKPEKVKELINENDFLKNVENHYDRVVQLYDYVNDGLYPINDGNFDIIPPNTVPDMEYWVLGTGNPQSTDIVTKIKANYCVSLMVLILKKWKTYKLSKPLFAKNIIMRLIYRFAVLYN
jgi:alkanesulfonate monooxygenase SsuD/methylene tetrahydromethanopterin reductase-like flavin-dependent oxidoreductase (luciferase family)